MNLSSLTNRGSTPALVKTLAFSQAHLKVIAENVANIQTPGYRAKQLDVRAFQRALRAALDAKGGDAGKSLVVKSGREVATDADGFLRVTPSEVPVENILFHDGTNLSLERQMAKLAETGMTHELATTLLAGNFDRIRTAIRGTVA
ncbi:MAG: flagellar basal body rod protein FlgB [Phycisphaerae bacterium]